MSTQHLTPYYSVIICEIRERNTTLAKIGHELRHYIQSEMTGIQWANACYELDIAQFLTLFFSEDSTPSWSLNSGPFVDHINHYLTIVRVDSWLLIHASDARTKEICLSMVDEKLLGGVSVVDSVIINYIFLRDRQIRALWLYGIHNRSSTKADSKAVFGDDLVDAIDAIGDQTYAFSAARSRLQIGGFIRSVGVSPDKGSVWIGPTNDWGHFKRICLDMFELISTSTGKDDSPIHTLCSPVFNVGSASYLYDFDLYDEEEFVGVSLSSESKLLDKVKADFLYEISLTKSSHVNGFRISVYEVVNLNKPSYVGDVDVNVFMDEKRIKFSIGYVDIQQGKKGRLDYFSRVFKHPAMIKGWYESGHVIAAGRLFQINYRDVEYGEYIWANFNGFDISKEKPINKSNEVDLRRIGLDDSLFCWIFKNWSIYIAKLLEKNWSPTNNWLYCDDGSGEMADFLDVSEYHGDCYITLIHVKASKSATGTNTRISVGAHDIVLNQAIKNIRYFDRKTLQEAMREKAKNKVGSKMVWNNGIKKTASDFESYLKSLSLKKIFRVVVVQPHTRRTYYSAKNSSLQRKQLDTLLVNAKNIVASIGAKFYIIGNDI